MRKHTTRIKKLITGLLIVIMGLFMVNRALYTHLHVLPDGSLISHAHPFSKKTGEPGQNNHQHSSREIFVLDQLTVLALSVNMFLIMMAVISGVSFLNLADDLKFLPLSPIAPARAPPACMY